MVDVDILTISSGSYWTVCPRFCHVKVQLEAVAVVSLVGVFVGQED
jgi:hypothetical protein